MTIKKKLSTTFYVTLDKSPSSSIALPSPLTDFPLAHSHLSTTLLFFKAPFAFSYPSFGAQWSRLCLPMQETQVRLLGREDPLEKEMATHSRILVWEIPWTEEPGGYSP